jgi:hypothetical protein
MSTTLPTQLHSFANRYKQYHAHIKTFKITTFLNNNILHNLLLYMFINNSTYYAISFAKGATVPTETLSETVQLNLSCCITCNTSSGSHLVFTLYALATSIEQPENQYSVYFCHSGKLRMHLCRCNAWSRKWVTGVRPLCDS